MTVVPTEEMLNLWEIIKPFLILDGVDYYLLEDAPEEIKEAEKEFDRLYAIEYERELNFQLGI